MKIQLHILNISKHFYSPESQGVREVLHTSDTEHH